jgi:hypothetical protein
MLSLVTGALSLTVGLQSMPASTRVPTVSMVSSFGKDFGKLPASVSMAGATPVVVGEGGGSYKGGDTLSCEMNARRESMSSDFVYGARESLGEAIGSTFKVGMVVPTMLKAAEPEPEPEPEPAELPAAAE